MKLKKNKIIIIKFIKKFYKKYGISPNKKMIIFFLKENNIVLYDHNNYIDSFFKENINSIYEKLNIPKPNNNCFI
ncbi:hypothetical protein NARSGI1_01810 [endosymbiont of Sipalinus gigas]|uniref:hypothetical protein n=1 Tax=endosymbiont of Sipalinus gigas TaxID=1972134 RepID=UPI000DC6EBFC|nr:hypothetical protein [endosymbiont of Sipalinus gigas]BBA85319.1 hypothetical protein NARSGI1_01810 [endosymbiont of Sipalinus gigas]